MKKIAFLLMMIFALVHAVPVALAVFTDRHAVFIASEEKSEEKSNSETNENNYETDLGFLTAVLSCGPGTPFHVVENTLPSPSSEKSTPPPNFS